MTVRHAERVVQVVTCALILASCAATGPGDTERRTAFTGKADGADDATVIAPDDARAVLVDRLVLASPEDPTVQRRAVFSHRSKAWHVFPFTTYTDDDYELEVSIDDPRMEGHVSVGVYRKAADGSWASVGDDCDVDRGDPRVTGDDCMVVDRGGYVSITLEPPGYAQWAVVVGPANEGRFLPRYPGRYMHALVEGASHDGHVYRDGDGDWKLVLDPGTAEAEELDVIDPLPEREDPTGDGLIWVERDGDAVPVDAFDWEQEIVLAPEGDEGGTSRYVGILEGDVYGHVSLSAYPVPIGLPPGAELREHEDYFVLQAFDGESLQDPGGNRSMDPDMLVVLPQAIDVAGTLRYPDLARTDDCEGGGPGCFVPYWEDGTPLSDEEIERHSRSFRVTKLAFDEQSGYSVELTCDGDACVPTVEATELPMYFAHGFNSSHAAWDAIMELLGTRPEALADAPGVFVGRAPVGIGGGWVAAGDVPGYEPLERRARQLRRNLAAYVDAMTAAGGEPRSGDAYFRLNVVAHSMGGLDSRTLTTHPRYNDLEVCTVAQPADSDMACFATPEAGSSTEPCCHEGVSWNERIASITTLSTPHSGSPVGDWLPRALRNSSLLDWIFRKVINFVFGLRGHAEEMAIETIQNLSTDFLRTREENDWWRAGTHARRSYLWECATQPEACQDIAMRGATWEEHFGVENLPRPAGVGEPLLPAPAPCATIFAWSAEYEVLDAAMRPLQGVMRGGDHVGPDSFHNDGVVGIYSAQYGISMGMRPNDHFAWTRKEEGFFTRAKRWLFGIEREPLERFYGSWFTRLREAGY